MKLGKALHLAYCLAILLFVSGLSHAQPGGVGIPDARLAFAKADDVVLARVAALGSGPFKGTFTSLHASVEQVLKGEGLSEGGPVSVNLLSLSPMDRIWILPGISKSLVGLHVLLFLRAGADGQMVFVNNRDGMLQTIPDDSGTPRHIPKGIAGVASALTNSFRNTIDAAGQVQLAAQGSETWVNVPPPSDAIATLRISQKMIPASNSLRAEILYQGLDAILTSIGADIAAPVVQASLKDNTQPIGRLWQSAYLYDTGRLSDPADLERFASSPTAGFPLTAFRVGNSICNHYYNHTTLAPGDIAALSIYASSVVEGIRGCAIQALGDFRSFEAVPFLAKALDDRSAMIRTRAVHGLCGQLPDVDGDQCDRYSRPEGREALLAAVASAAKKAVRQQP